MDFLRRVFYFIRDIFKRFGLELRYVPVPKDNIPDRQYYAPLFSPWLLPEERTKLRADDLQAVASVDRKYLLWQLATQCARALPGNLAELGVYRGGSAYVLARAAREAGTGKTVHLFDSFSGMPETSKNYDVHQEGDFADAPLAQVKAYLSDFADEVVFHPGFVPATFAGLDDTAYCFAHIDLDLHDAIRDATAFLYPRMARGSVILYDDYGFPTCPGARKAVDEFFADKPEMPVVLPMGQCLVVKV
jgi:O-methyltransferase